MSASLYPPLPDLATMEARLREWILREVRLARRRYGPSAPLIGDYYHTYPIEGRAPDPVNPTGLGSACEDLLDLRKAMQQAVLEPDEFLGFNLHRAAQLLRFHASGLWLDESFREYVRDLRPQDADLDDPKWRFESEWLEEALIRGLESAMDTAACFDEQYVRTTLHRYDPPLVMSTRDAYSFTSEPLAGVFPLEQLWAILGVVGQDEAILLPNVRSYDVLFAVCEAFGKRFV